MFHQTKALSVYWIFELRDKNDAFQFHCRLRYPINLMEVPRLTLHLGILQLEFLESQPEEG